MENRIPLLFVVETMGMNGATISMLRLMEALPKERYDVHLFLFAHEGVLMDRIPEGVKLLDEIPEYAVFMSSFSAGVANCLKGGHFKTLFLRVLVAVLRKLKVIKDVKTCMGRPTIRFPGCERSESVAISYVDGFSSEVLVKRVRASHKVCWLHDHANFRFTDGELRTLCQADAVACCSRGAFKIFSGLLKERGFEARRVLAVNNIVDTEKVIRLAEESREARFWPVDSRVVLRLVSVGRVNKDKNFLFIPEIAKVLRERGREFCWVVAGAETPDYAEACKAKAVEYGIADAVKFVGRVENQFALIASSDIVVQPSVQEGFLMVAAEAQLLHKPVVLSDLPVFEDFVGNWHTAVSAPLGDARAFAAQIEGIADGKIRLNLDFFEKFGNPCSVENVLSQFNGMIDAL